MYYVQTIDVLNKCVKVLGEHCYNVYRWYVDNFYRQQYFVGRHLSMMIYKLHILRLSWGRLGSLVWSLCGRVAFWVEDRVWC